MFEWLYKIVTSLFGDVITRKLLGNSPIGGGGVELPHYRQYKMGPDGKPVPTGNNRVPFPKDTVFMDGDSSPEANEAGFRAAVKHYSSPSPHHAPSVHPHATPHAEPRSGVVPAVNHGAYGIPLVVTSEFGPRGGGFHRGVDLRAGAGDPVTAICDGTVTIGNKYPEGLYVSVLHDDGYRSIYCHLSSVAGIENGQRVKGGHVIGGVGDSGHSNGYHLHLSVHDPSGKPVNPLLYVAQHGQALPVHNAQLAGRWSPAAPGDSMLAEARRKALAVVADAGIGGQVTHAPQGAGHVPAAPVNRPEVQREVADTAPARS